MQINPIVLDGNWIEGYAMDYHTKYSIYIGDNQWGHPDYDTKRTEIGELLYQLKYRNDQSKVNEILELIKPFLGRMGYKE